MGGPNENTLIKCMHCKIEYPETRVLYKHIPPECEDNGCDHEPMCGLCMVLQSPKDAIVNIDILNL